MRGMLLRQAATALVLLAGAPPVRAWGDAAQECWQRPFDRAHCRVGPHAQVARRVRPTPGPVRQRYGARARVYSIDVDRDAKPEFIVERLDRDGRRVNTCFLGSLYQERRCWDDAEASGFAYWWFVELEPGKPLFALVLEGDEDTSESGVFRIDPGTWVLSKVLEFEPIAVDRGLVGPRAFPGTAWNLSDISLVHDGGRILLRVLPRGACNVPAPPPSSLPTVNELVGLVFDGLPVGVRGAGCARAVAHARLLTLAEAIRLAAAPVTLDKDGVPVPVEPGFEPAPPAEGEPLADPQRQE